MISLLSEGNLTSLTERNSPPSNKNVLRIMGLSAHTVPISTILSLARTQHEQQYPSPSYASIYDLRCWSEGLLIEP